MRLLPEARVLLRDWKYWLAYDNGIGPDILKKN
ncbi:hypothetical protein C21_01464 [Arenibacter sp. NBRC 103722]|nr:hypothetical protein C21_01464 [Arenibacter sp. NBRC 103722]